MLCDMLSVINKKEGQETKNEKDGKRSKWPPLLAVPRAERVCQSPPKGVAQEHPSAPGAQQTR